MPGGIVDHCDEEEAEIIMDAYAHTCSHSSLFFFLEEDSEEVIKKILIFFYNTSGTFFTPEEGELYDFWALYVVLRRDNRNLNRR